MKNALVLLFTLSAALACAQGKDFRCSALPEGAIKNMVVNEEIVPGLKAQNFDHSKALAGGYPKMQSFLFRLYIQEVMFQTDGSALYFGYSKPGSKIVVINVERASPYIRPNTRAVFYARYLATKTLGVKYPDGKTTMEPMPVFYSNLFGVKFVDDRQKGI